MALPLWFTRDAEDSRRRLAGGEITEAEHAARVAALNDELDERRREYAAGRA